MSEPDAQFKVVKVDPEGSGMDYVGHLGSTIHNARRCCENCTVIFGSFADRHYDPAKPESAANDPTPIGPFVIGELEPINAPAEKILGDLRAQFPGIFETKEIIQKVSKVLRDNLSKEEMVRLGSALDGGAGDLLLDSVNEILQEIAPEVFGEVEEKV